jgi:flagellar motility protein MotE (MotC chaperone)
MKRAVETLLRLRRAERDAKLRTYALARAEHVAAQGRREHAAARARAAAERLRALGAEGRLGGWWHPAQFGLVALAEQVERESELECAAARSLEHAEAEARSAERALAALERLTERLALRERASRARAAQRRIEDIAASIRRVVLSLALCACTLAAGRAGAEDVNPAIVPLLADLQARHAELDRRERAVEDRERHAGELEKVAGARLAEAEAIATAVEQRIEGWRAEQGDKSIGRLARIYGGMPPPKAGPLLERFDLDLATRIVAKMKPAQSAALLPFLSPERAIAMSWLVAHPLAMKTGGDPSAAEPKP